jgi:hypothetical protein
MFTKESIELRHHFLPLSDVKSSKELKKLYEHFKNIKLQPLHEIYYNQTNKMDIKLEPSKYVPDQISRNIYTMNQTIVVFIVGKLKIKLIIHGEKEVKTFIEKIKHVIRFVCSLSSITINELVINYYLIDEKKMIGKNTKILTPYEINSGFCNDESKLTEITIYRTEEIIKVTIHELIHALQYDYREESNKIISHYQNKYNITSERINSYEAYTEIWANIINCYLLSQMVKRSNYDLFITLIAIEKAFTRFQTEKVFYITDLSTKKIDINEKTNTLSYFIIRCELYQKLNLFLKFCRLNNNYVKMKNTAKWFDFLKKNQLVKKNNRRFNRINKQGFLYKNMRMSMNELNIY